MASFRDPSGKSPPRDTESPRDSHSMTQTQDTTIDPRSGPQDDAVSEEDFDFERELLRSFERQPRDEVLAQANSGPIPPAEARGRRSSSRRRKRAAGNEAAATAPFNSPFEQLKGLARKVAEQKKRSEPLAEQIGGAVIGGNGETVQPVRSSMDAAQDDETLFARAMAGVEPLPNSNDRTLRRSPAASPVVDEEAEALARLSDLVAGTQTFDISDTAEYVEGIAKGLDRRLLSRLRKGQYAVQAHLDLHGMTRQEAKQAVFDFLVTARRRSLRCLLVITGRGRHSQDKEPVLKTALTEWLTGKKLGRHVLAFCSARPHDGGAGAFYVLLRR